MLSGHHYSVTHVWKLHNEIQSDVRFFVSKKAVDETLQKVNAYQEDIIAIFHSHPSTLAIPSHYDILHHADQEVMMVIVSFIKDIVDVRAYRIVERRSFPHKIRVVDDTTS